MNDWSRIEAELDEQDKKRGIDPHETRKSSKLEVWLVIALVIGSWALAIKEFMEL